MSSCISCSHCMTMADFLHTSSHHYCTVKPPEKSHTQSMQWCVESLYQELNLLYIWLGNLKMILAGWATRPCCKWVQPPTLNCTVGPPSTRTGILLDHGTTQRSGICPQLKDARREETRSCVNLAVLWACTSEQRKTKITMDLPVWNSFQTSSPSQGMLFFRRFTLLPALHDSWVITETLYILISSHVLLLSLIWVHWLYFWFWTSEAVLGGTIGTSGNSLLATHSPNKKKSRVP